MTPPLTSVDELHACLGVLLGSDTSPGHRRRANEQLHNFRRGPHAWAVSLAVLEADPLASTPLALFAAQTVVALCRRNHFDDDATEAARARAVAAFSPRAGR